MSLASDTSSLSTSRNALNEDDEYVSLEKLSLALTSNSTDEDGEFTLCFWLYLLPSSTPGVVIRQGRPNAQFALPFLTINPNRILTLYPLPPPLEPSSTVPSIDQLVGLPADRPCAIGKWVHVACRISRLEVVLFMDAEIVAQKTIPFNEETGLGAEGGLVLLSGGDGNSSGDSVVGFAHYVRLVDGPLVDAHHKKNPPLELTLEDYDGLSEDESDDPGGKIWTVIGGKSSYRRAFTLDVALVDALGNENHRDLELLATLNFLDGSPVKPIPSQVTPPQMDADLEPVLLQADTNLKDQGEVSSGTGFIFQELQKGRATFCLKTSVLSSRYDYRPMKVVISASNAPNFPFLQTSSPPLIAVSRNRGQKPQIQNPQIGPPSTIPIMPVQGVQPPNLMYNMMPYQYPGQHPGWTVPDSTAMIAEATSTEPVGESLAVRYLSLGMGKRAEFLEAFVRARGDEEVGAFALKVSQYSGCGHNGYQIMIARELLETGEKMWSQLLQEASEKHQLVKWTPAVCQLAEEFYRLAGVKNRRISQKEELFLRRISLGVDTSPLSLESLPEAISQAEFQRLWRWIFPVGLTLSANQIAEMWEGEVGANEGEIGGKEGKVLLHGMVSREEAEALLRTSEVEN